MTRALSALLVLAVVLALQPRPVAAVWQNTGEIAGTAVVEGKPLSGVIVRLRNVDTGDLVATGTTNARGEFKFTGLPPGKYVVETVTADGKTLLGTSAGIGLTAGSMVAGGVTVSTSAAAAAAAGVAGAGAAGAGAAGAGAAAAGAAAGAAGAGAAGAAAGAAAAGGAFFATTAGIVTAVAAGAGLAAAVAVAATASPSS
jgi:hypothetical protein